MVRNVFLSIFLPVLLLLNTSCNKERKIFIFPAPESLVIQKGEFKLSEPTYIETVNLSEKEFLVEYLTSKIHSHSNNFVHLKKEFPGKGKKIRLVHDTSATQNEHYILKITTDEIEIAGSHAGLLYGINTLSQLIDVKKMTIPCVDIEDKPQFKWRGMHLDVSRHFFDTAFIKKYIDILATHKMNIFHWHLTDDQGWRIEIKKYPELTEKAAWRKDRRNQPWSYDVDFTNEDDPKAYGGYYTQEEIKELVEYARLRNVTIIPEIEMPGHSQAALYAFPQLSCSGEIYRKPDNVPFQFTDPFCAGNDSTFIFLKDILDEVISIFPSEYIHIGGDEARKEPWMHCDKCRKRMKEENLSDPGELQAWFIEEIYDYLHSKGRKLIGWNEIMEGDIRTDAAIMAWKGEGIAAEAITKGYPTVSAESEFYYLSRAQDGQSDMMGRLLSLEKVYGHNPFGEILNSKNKSKALGMQGCIWTEDIQTGTEIEEHLLPRMLAIAERSWIGFEESDYHEFSGNLIKYFNYLDRENINYYINGPLGLFDDKFSESEYSISLETRILGSKIYYTLDGTDPEFEDKLYSSPIIIKDSETVKAYVFLPSGKTSPVFTANYEKVSLMESKELEKTKSGIGLKYSFTEINTLDNIETIIDWKDTTTATLSIPNFLKDQDNFCLKMEGLIKIPEDGVYRFFISSDDGSRLYINGQLICDNDGVHGSNFYIKGFAGLKEGFHSIRLEYFEAKYGENLIVEMEGPAFSRKTVPAELLYFNTTQAVK